MNGPGKQSAASAEQPGALEEGPLVSVVMPAYETPQHLLVAAIDSVRSQTYPTWELRIVDDGSSDPGVSRALRRSAGEDERIRPMRLERNEGISRATNRALEACEGELVAFLDHDDLLAPGALHRIVEEFLRRPETEVVYSDEDKLTAKGKRMSPFFKPDFSPVYALGAMYVGHLLTVRRGLLSKVDGLDPAFDTIQDFELLLRLSEQSGQIRHVPEVLYHWRAVAGSIAAGAEHKPQAGKLQVDAVNAHLARRRIPARATAHPTLPHRVRLVAPSGFRRPSVSVIVASAGNDEHLARCLGSVLEWSAGDELIAVVPGGHPPLPAGVRRLEPRPKPLHRAEALNAGAREAHGELLVFLSETVEVRNPEWLGQLALIAGMPDAGPVGPMLARPDGRVAEAGWVLGLDDPASPAMEGIDADGDGHYGTLACAREVSALSGACMMLGRQQFVELGGFRQDYHRGFEDFDLCCRSLQAGRAPIYTPAQALIRHDPPAERRRAVDVVDRGLFVDSFYDRLGAGDPFYSPNLSRAAANFEPRQASQ